MRLGGVMLAFALSAACGKVSSSPETSAGNGGVLIPSGGGSANAPGGGGVGNLGGRATGGFGAGSEWEKLGTQCAVDAECGSVTKCLLATSDALEGEGPAKGYCTFPCGHDPTVCAQFQQTGAAPVVCHVLSTGDAYCLEGCLQGPDGLSQFDPDKCHGRQEVACRPLVSSKYGYTGSACFPQCNSDTDCGGALLCNPKTGRCTTTLPPGQPLGAGCASWGVCQGVCHSLGTSSGVGVCSSSCTLGAIPSCGWEGPGTGPAPAACLYAAPHVAENGGPGIGDFGYCGKLCDCETDCAQHLACVPWPGSDAEALADFYQRAGYCGDPESEGVGTLCDGLKDALHGLVRIPTSDSSAPASRARCSGRVIVSSQSCFSCVALRMC